MNFKGYTNSFFEFLLKIIQKNLLLTISSLIWGGGGEVLYSEIIHFYHKKNLEKWSFYAKKILKFSDF